MTNHQDVPRYRTAAVIRAIDYMKARLDHPQSLDELARTGQFSPFHFHRIFLEVTAVTPARFLVALRMAEARRLLAHSPVTIRDVSRRVGYQSLGTFTTQFGRHAGLSPGQFRRLMRALRDASVGELLPAIQNSGSSRRGPLLALSGMQTSSALMLTGLSPVGSLPERPAWTATTATDGVRLASVPKPGEYAAFLAVVPTEVRMRDAFVDGTPGTYLIGAARMRLPSSREPLMSVALRCPRPTDPPVLAATSLRWLSHIDG